MSQLLTVYMTVMAYSDGSSTNNPQLQDFSYHRQLPDQPTTKTRSQKYFVSPGESETALNLQRSLTTGASWTLSLLSGTLTARCAWSGVNPLLRTERTGSTLEVATTYSIARLSSSRVVRVNFGTKIVGTSIVVGDEIYFGAGSGLSASEQGVYPIVGVSTNYVDIIAPDLVDQVVTLADAADVYAFSSGPVRVNDYVRLGTAFAFGNRGEFQVTRVTSRFIEFQNGECIPEGPITQDLTIYEQVYKVLFLESDQRVNVYINGAVTPLAIEPYMDGQSGMVGYLMVRTPVYSLSIENLGETAANVTTFFAT